MHPADPEADSRRAKAVGERQQRRLASARDDDPVHLDAVDEGLDQRFVRRRLVQCFFEVSFQILHAVHAENRALSTRVHGLENGGKPGRRECLSGVLGRANRGVRRLRDSRLGEHAAHLELVGHPVRGVDSDTREAELVRHGGNDRHGAVGRDRQHTVDALSAADLGDRGNVGEVHDLGDVGRGEPGRVRIAIDGDDSQVACACVLDRAALVATCADEEDGLHGGRC